MSIEALREMPHPSLDTYMMSRGLSPRFPMFGGYLPSPYSIKTEPGFGPFSAPPTPSVDGMPMVSFRPSPINYDFSKNHQDDKVRKEKPLPEPNLAENVKQEDLSPVAVRKDSFSSPTTYERMPTWERGATPSSLTNHSSPYTMSPPTFYDGGHYDAHIKRSLSGQSDLYFCHLCSYSGTSKYDFNEHMNGHFDHSCPYCDYTSRTEGRLKRHIKDFHSDDMMAANQRTIPGRPKLFRCKQCDFVASDKVEYWTHARTHIKDEKLLQCPKCPFVTEYKHHLEYHLRNHFGSKPFKCDKCNYACVNKSMLNSHMKSHTNVYQYRCADCTYATKYCHSLKLHLRKYNHKPATILNPDGSLPQGVNAETSGVSLLAKRGPPRGPRGPRKDKFESYLNSLVSLPHHPLPQRAMHVNGAMINPFWPYLGAQLPAPGFHPSLPSSFPLPPTSGFMMGHNFPFDRRYPSLRTSSPSPVISDNSDKKDYECSICGFVAQRKDYLARHMVHAHAAENQDLFRMFGISSDTVMDARNEYEAQDQMEQEDDSIDDRDSLRVKTDFEPSGSQSCPLTWPTESRHSTLPLGESAFLSKSLPDVYSITKEDHDIEEQESAPSSPDESPKGVDILKQMTLRFGCDSIEKESPLDLTKPKSFNEAIEKDSTHGPMSQHYLPYYTPIKQEFNLCPEQSAFAEDYSPKRKLDDHKTQADDGHPSDAPSPSPRKRSRKGKAYKLDTLCWKLKGLTASSAYSDKSPETHSDDEKDTESDDCGESGLKLQDRTVKVECDTNQCSSTTDDACVNQNRRNSGQSDHGQTDHGQKDHGQMDHRINEDAVNEATKKKNNNNAGKHYQEFSKINNIINQEILNNRSPTIPEIAQNSNALPSGLLNPTNSQSPAMRRGAEIAWKILHPNEQLPQTNVNNDGVADVTQTTLPVSSPPALIKVPADIHSPYPDKINGLNRSYLGRESYECTYCDIAFRDCVMYTMHMGYHGYRDPYQCNMCGHLSKNRVDFFLHIARAAHA